MGPRAVADRHAPGHQNTCRRYDLGSEYGAAAGDSHSLGGHLKTGQLGSLQNRPVDGIQDNLFYLTDNRRSKVFFSERVTVRSGGGLPQVEPRQGRGRGGGVAPNPSESSLPAQNAFERSALGRCSARAAAERRRRCPRLSPGGGNGKGGESSTLLPQADFFPPPVGLSPRRCTLTGCLRLR